MKAHRFRRGGGRAGGTDNFRRPAKQVFVGCPTLRVAQTIDEKTCFES